MSDSKQTLTINGEAVAAPVPVAPVDFINGVVQPFPQTTPMTDVFSPVVTDSGEKVLLGQFGSMTSDEALVALKAAKTAWKGGRGEWPTTSMEARVQVVEAMLDDLVAQRDAVANVLMWEICKKQVDSYKEFDRTMQYGRQTIAHIRKELAREAEENKNESKELGAAVTRRPLGVVLVLGPANYPFNETYAMLLPALLSGNTVVLKVPRVGGLCHYLLAETLCKHLPKGVINYVSGGARATMPALMQSRMVDMLAFIGSTKAADSLMKAHPAPHRLQAVLGLEANNPGIVFPSADLQNAVKQAVAGSLSFNGQRCTAIKLLLVHESIVDEFMAAFKTAVEAVKYGLPWEEGILVTPVAASKVTHMQELVADAVSKGASVVNANGGELASDRKTPLLLPAVLYPCQPSMRVWAEEQFGPVVPVGTFTSTDNLMDILDALEHGQQAAIFGSPSDASTILNPLLNMYGRVNIDVACSRGPDHLPFGGRKSSALGVLSIPDAMRTFSVESVLWRRGTTGL